MSKRIKPHKNKKGWTPTREEFHRMAIKHDTLLQFAKDHATNERFGYVLTTLAGTCLPEII